RLNVYGRPLIQDAFTVADTSFATGSVTGLRRGGGNPADNAITLAVSGRRVGINNNTIDAFGFETTRIVTLFGTDTVFDPLSLAFAVNVWNPLSSDWPAREQSRKTTSAGAGEEGPLPRRRAGPDARGQCRTFGPRPSWNGLALLDGRGSDQLTYACAFGLW